MQLQSRALTLIDSEGDPKFPLFLYDPDLVDRSITQGLFRGPFLLAVSISPPHGAERYQPQSFRFTCVFLCRHPLRLAERYHQSVEMRKSTA